MATTTTSPQPMRTTSVRLPEETYERIDATMSTFGFDSYSDALRVATTLMIEQIADATEAIAGTFTATEWACMADLFRNERPGNNLAGNALAKHLANIAHTIHRSSGLGAKHFGENAADSIKTLVGKLRKLSLMEAWAVLMSVMWARRHEASIDFGRDRWWTLDYRHQLGRKSSR